MEGKIAKLAIIGQGLIGSSITRAVYERRLVTTVTVTDVSDKVRKRVRELGLGHARVVDTAREAVRDADLVIACVPVGQIADVIKDIAPYLKEGAIVSDVGSVKASVVADIRPNLPEGAHLVPAHPLAGTEFSGPDAGMPRLFVKRWCILTPEEHCDADAVAKVKTFWEGLGSTVEVMSPERHDYVLAFTSHLPHMVAFSIFQTALRYEEMTEAEVIKFSAGGFRDFTRIASSNPTMWRDIFLKNREPVLSVLKMFVGDLEHLAEAIENDDGDELLKMFSSSRITRRKVIEKEHISVQQDEDDKRPDVPLLRPYASDDW
ncbi:MAG: prephenate dehydrogenase/arogenate dehydrogenase family protein [Nitratireductor sp.]|nr:prephenate dehydrogenase/arogenate dehydrogenase family protein [Nitratireductor sp.]